MCCHWPRAAEEEPTERPDFLIHSYGKHLSSSGAATAGVVIARKQHMFIPKGQSAKAPGPDGQSRVYRWDETLFWNVYFVKGAAIDIVKALDVLNGLRTHELRMLQKCTNTVVMARVLAAHPQLNVRCSAVPGDAHHLLARRLLFLGLPAPL